jgi:predicted 3-demethylubiquinone-9 3-methyltransferase (glyoxalase superfamily)
MQKITPHLWFDKEAKQAAEFYTQVFPDTKIKTMQVLHNTPSGDVDTLTLDIMGQEFAFISAGPYFKINPSVSFLVACTTKEEVETIWEKLSPGGVVMME